MLTEISRLLNLNILSEMKFLVSVVVGAFVAVHFGDL